MMTSQKKTNQQGAATLVFLLVMALFVSLLAAVTYSRLLVSIKRSLSQADAVVTNYDSESAVNDILAKLKAGYFDEGNFAANYTETIEGTTLRIVRSQTGNTQSIVVTGERSFAVSRIEATRVIDSVSNVDNVDMILSLDCTGSMNAAADPTRASAGTRFDAQKDAALNFVDRLIAITADPKYAGKFRLGIMVFGMDAKWLTLGGSNVTPGSVQLSEIKTALNAGFGSTRATSSACTSVMDATSVGSAYAASHDYFKLHKSPKTKQVEIVITDGEPNTRIPYGGCGPSVFCPSFPKSSTGQNYCDSNEYGWSCYNGDSYKDGPYDADNFNQAAYNMCEPLGRDFLTCAIADTGTSIPPIPQSATNRKGVRDPDVSAYGVTILTNPPPEVVSIFTTYLSPNGYFNATRASQLKNILNTVLNEILRDHSTITIKRTPPTS